LIKFSFIIPTYNRFESLIELLQSIDVIDTNGETIELIVVNDGSTDDTDMNLVKWQPINLNIELRFCTIPNGGPAKARNHGASMAVGKWLIFLDDDCIVPKNYLTSLGHVISTNVDCLAICGNIIGFNQSLLSRFIDWTGLMQSPNDSSKGKLYFLTANAIVDRSLFLRLGGFNTSFRFASGEDVFLSNLIRESGHHIYFFRDCFVWHKHRDTISGIYKTCKVYGIGHFQLELLNGKSYRRQMLPCIMKELVDSSKKVYRSKAFKYGVFFVFYDLVKIFAWTRGYNMAFDMNRYKQSYFK